MIVYLFFRKGCFYPLELPSDTVAIENALNNPGTLRVERATGELVWEAKVEKSAE